MKLLIFLLIVTAFLLGYWWVFMFAWNTVANYFHFPTITFWVAAALNIGLSILFSGLRSARKA